MKILLVGGSSALARSLRPRLAAFADVTTAGRQGSDLHLDLAGDIKIEPGYDTVINTAAHFGGDRADLMAQAERTNVEGLLRLMGASEQAGVGQLLHISSIFAELPPTSPFVTSYSLSKRHGDEAARLCASALALRLAILRPSQMYGSGELSRRRQPFLYSLLDRAQNNEDITLYGSHDAWRNFIHVDDVARLVALAVQRDLEGTFQCAHPEDVSFSRMANAAISAFGSSSTVSFATDKLDIDDNIFAPDDALYRAVGSAPEISIEAGMRAEADGRRATQ